MLVACVTAPARWEPDTQLVAAVLSSPKAVRPMAELAAPDRAWLVAGLTLAGLTAKDIADRLGCSLRLVRSIRAEPSTQVCLIAQIEARNFADELRLEKSEHQVTRCERDAARVLADRLKMQLDHVLDAHIVSGALPTCSKGHPMTTYNTYRSQGRNYCRECRRDWQASRKVVLISTLVTS